MRWNREQIDLLVDGYPEGDLIALAAQIGCTEGQMRSKASSMGVKRSDAIKAANAIRMMAKARESRYLEGSK